MSTLVERQTQRKVTENIFTLDVNYQTDFATEAAYSIQDDDHITCLLCVRTVLSALVITTILADVYNNYIAKRNEQNLYVTQVR